MVFTKIALTFACFMAGCEAQFGGGLGGGLGGLGGGAVEPPPDLGCLTGPHAATWQQVKGIFRSVFPQDGPPNGIVAREKLVAALDDGMKKLTDSKALAPESMGECGLGRLALQLMTLTTVEDTGALVQIFSESEQLASPVLTFLLDINWVLIGQSGWPIFAYLGQINNRKQHEGITINDAGDGLDTELPKAFLTALREGMAGEDYGKVVQTSAEYLQAEGNKSPLSLLTAFASQAMALSAGERVRVLQDMQNALKQMIGGAPELDIALSTRWPMWGLSHSAIDAFYAD